MSIYHSKNGKNQKRSSNNNDTRTSLESLSEVDNMLNTMAKKWISDKATTSIEPQELLNKMLQSAEGSKILEQGKTFVKDLFDKVGNKKEGKTDSNEMDWDKVIQSLEEKGSKTKSKDVKKNKEEAMDIISQVLDRTKEILNDDTKDKDK